MFCGKCRKHYDSGGVGTGRQYRCAKCHAQRLAAMLTGEARVKGCKWSQQEVERLKSVWSTAPLREVYAAFPGRTQDSIRRAAERNGLYRPPELVAESLRERGQRGAEVLRKQREKRELAEEAMLALNQVITREFAPVKFTPDPLQQVISQWGRS